MYNRWNLALLGLISALTIFSILVVWPGWPKRYLPDFIDYPEGPMISIAGRDAMKLGLDLNGGTYVLLEAESSQLPSGTDLDAAMEGAKNVIERRINALGVGETEITREGKNRLAVQLPGIPPEQAGELIGKTALLEFREPRLDDNRDVICITADGNEFHVGSTSVTQGVNAAGQKESQCVGSAGETGTVEWQPALAQDSQGETRALTGRYLKANSAQVVTGTVECVPACVELEFTGEGSLLFDKITTRLINYPLGIFLDEELIGSPIVRSVISDGRTIITGLSIDEAKTLRVQLNAGALPVEMREIQKQEIDATLGENTLVRTVQAGLIGILAVMFFMIVYYRLPGILASLALVTYVSTVMMVFKLFPGQPITVTLPGIAGFVLSVGMAVDANILVFERMKEELRAGRSLPSAIEHGFDRAWSSIRDSNIATLITAFILWWFGREFSAAPVTGFAIALAIGVLVSMFSAIVVTRTFLRLMVGSPMARRVGWFAPDLHREGGRARPSTGYVLDFVKRRGIYFALSALILVPGLLSLAIPPALKPGIEFSSGATFTVHFDDASVTQKDVSGAMAELGHDEARVQRTSDGSYIVRLKDIEGPAGPPVGAAPPGPVDVIRDGLVERFGAIGKIDNAGTFTDTGGFSNFSSVSEIVSKAIGRNSAIAVGTAALAILVYISFSFRNVPKPWRYGVAAIVAAMHDALFILGAFSIFGKLFDTEINTMFITGVLTVIGFSVHDTIVVFDRIRENVARYPDAPFDEVVNASLSETVARSINTSFTVVITVVSLLLLGGSGIDSLLVALFLGIAAGTYSSIFIASQILVSWEDGDFARIWRKVVPRRQVPAEAAG